jgi:hypothetical protein
MLREGFEDFESRRDRSNAPPKTSIAAAPQWTGQHLKGRSILVWDKQGLGDLIQFSRYLPLLVEAGAEVTALCRKNIQRLLGALPKPARFVEALDRTIAYDYRSALLSLPRGFGTTLETIPLRPETDLIKKWAARVGANGYRIGVCWRGNASINVKRSVPVSCFGALAAIDGVRLISLVKDKGAIRIATARGSRRIESLGADFDAGAVRRRYGASRSDRHVGHCDRPSGRRIGPASLRRAEAGGGLALAAGATRLPVVSDDAPPVRTRPMEPGFRCDCGRS